MLVFLVAGGNSDRSGIWAIGSTEILIEGHSSWKTVGNLPSPSEGIRGVSFHNNIIMTGNTKTTTLSVQCDSRWLPLQKRRALFRQSPQI